MVRNPRKKLAMAREKVDQVHVIKLVIHLFFYHFKILEIRSI